MTLSGMYGWSWPRARGRLELHEPELPYPTWQELELSRTAVLALETETRLVNLALAGDQEAFSHLVHHYTPMVYRLAFGFLKNEEEARDLTQDVFLVLYRKLETFRGESRLKTWLYQVTTNRAKNKLRWQKVRFWKRTRSTEEPITEDGTTLGSTLATKDPDPERRMAGTQARQALKSALEELPEDFRTAVVLRDIEGLRYDEIAEMMDVTVGTVKSRIARGRKLLKEALAPYMENLQ